MKLEPSFETETYITKKGYYCIKQANDTNEEDSIILLTREQVKNIIIDMESEIDRGCILQ